MAIFDLKWVLRDDGYMEQFSCTINHQHSPKGGGTNQEPRMTAPTRRNASPGPAKNSARELDKLTCS